MSEYREVKLSDVMEIIGGGTPKTSIPEYWGGEIPWISVVDFNTGNKFVYTTEKTITERGLKESSTKYLNSGDIIISARGTVGALAVLSRPMTFNQSCYGLRAKSDLCNNGYLYYLIKDSISELQSHTYGAVFDTITKNTFDNIIVEIPSLFEQESIAEVLSSLDDKIDLLHRNNKTLEQLAETLFRQWFVEEADDSWIEVKLKEYIKTISGYSYRSVDLNPSKTALVTLKSFDRKGGFRHDGFKEYSGKYKQDQIVRTGDLIVAHTDITQEAEVLGNPAIVIGSKKYETLIISTDIVKVEPVSYLTKQYLYFLMKSNEFKHYCLGASNGTTVLHLSKSALPDYDFRLPEYGIVEKFTKVVEPILIKMSSNQAQIIQLESLRDTLLPKLMSGTVRVMN